MARYPKGEEYPYEGFVQRALQDRFAARGFVTDDTGYADLVCLHPDTQERWVIEAKGQTTSCNVDFNTGLGQLLQRMDAETSTKYALAFPDTPKFRRQCSLLSQHVRRKLNLCWLIVDETGEVTVDAPE